MAAITPAEITTPDWQLSLAGLGEVVTDADDIAQCIRTIITTRPGADPFRPFFGCGAHEHLDKPLAAALPAMKRDIIEAVGLWERRVRLEKVTAVQTLAGLVFSLYLRGYSQPVELSLSGLPATTPGLSGLPPAYTPPPAGDADANAFIAAAALTDSTQIAAIRQLVDALKTANLWNKFEVAYPFVGGTAASHAVNLKAPGTHTLAYSLGQTGAHTATGWQPVLFADTGFSPLGPLAPDDTHVAMYSRTGNTTLGSVDMACGDPYFELALYGGVIYSRQPYTDAHVVTPLTNSAGLFLCTRTSNTAHAVYRNGQLIGANNGTRITGLPATTLKLGGDGGGYPGYRQFAWASAGRSFDDSEAATFGQIIEDFQTALSRPYYDADSAAFFAVVEGAGGALTSEEKATVDTLVIQLKEHGIWSRCRAIYPMVGGTDAAHCINLREPSSHRLDFYDNPTHNSEGVEFDGSSQYADTGVKIFADVPNWAQSNHLAFYNRHPGGIEVNNWVMGVGDTATGDPLFGLFVRRQGDLAAYDSGNASAGTRTQGTNTNGRGFVIGSTVPVGGGVERVLYKNGALLAGPNTANDTPASPNAPITLGVLNPTAGLWYYTRCVCAFASIGDGLEATHVADYYTIVQAFQTALGRAV